MEHLEPSPAKLPSRRERQRQRAAAQAQESAQSTGEKPLSTGRHSHEQDASHRTAKHEAKEYDPTREHVSTHTGIIRIRHGVRHAPGTTRVPYAMSESESINPALRRGLHTSALTVAVLSLATFILWFTPWESWACSLVVALASCLLAAGWPSLTNTKVTVPAQVTVGLEKSIAVQRVTPPAAGNG